MTLFDVILIVLLCGFIFYGLFFGLVQTLGGLIGVFFGAIIASRFFVPVAEFAVPIFGGNLMLSKFVCFLVIFIIVNRGVGLIFYIVDRIFDFVKIVPFVKSINRILGAILGFFEGAFLLGGILYIAARFPFWEVLNNAMVNSSVTKYLVAMFKLISFLIPEAIRQLESLL